MMCLRSAFHTWGFAVVVTKSHNKLLLSPLRGWDLRSGALRLLYGPKAKRYVSGFIQVPTKTGAKPNGQ